MVTWTQLGLHAKPCGVLNVLGYYSLLMAMLDHAVEERFLKPENRGAGAGAGVGCRTAASTGRVASGAGREMAGSGDAVGREEQRRYSGLLATLRCPERHSPAAPTLTAPGAETFFLRS